MHNDVDRIPPHNIEAEMALIGSVLVDHEIITMVSEHVSADDFYAHVHESIWLAIVELDARKQRPDKIAVAEELKQREKLETCGGLSYLNALMDTVQTAASAIYYAKIVAEKAGLRRLIDIGHRAVSASYDGEQFGPTRVGNRVVAEIERAVLAHTPTSVTIGPSTTSIFLDDFNSTGVKALQTPWRNLNQQIKGGFAPRELVVVGGHPGQGKTAWATCLCDFMARTYGKDMGPAVFYPLEMGKVMTLYRFASLYTGIEPKLIQQRRLDGDGYLKVSRALDMIDDLPMAIFEKRPQLNMANFRMQMRKQKRQHGLSSIFVDHLGCFEEVDENDNTHRAQTRILNQCLDLADELAVPLFMLMHIRRLNDVKNLDRTTTPMPTMYDLRGGGNAEGIASTIVLIWRPRPEGDEREKREGWAIIPKARSGGEGRLPIEFYGGQSLWIDGHDPDLWFPMATTNGQVRLDIANPVVRHEEAAPRLPYRDSVDEPVDDIPPPPEPVESDDPFEYKPPAAQPPPAEDAPGDDGVSF
jgi:replicative DNA helicase